MNDNCRLILRLKEMSSPNVLKITQQLVTSLADKDDEKVEDILRQGYSFSTLPVQDVEIFRPIYQLFFYHKVDKIKYGFDNGYITQADRKSVV